MKKIILTLTYAIISLLFVSSCSNGAKVPTAQEVMEVSKRVADWQITTFADQGKYRALPEKQEDREKWHHRERYHDLEWHCGAFYAGLFEFAEVADDVKYYDWLTEMGRKHKWSLHTRMYHADDHAVGQFYTGMMKYYDKGVMIKPTQIQFDSIMVSEQGKKLQWHWCDALFMAPTVWARLSNITGNMKYLDYMDNQYHQSYNLLWSKKDHLFFRDKKYLKMTENNGESLFWARGNGWVFGGLALMIPEMPENWAGRDFYITTFKEMAAKLKEIQRPDGTWSAGLLGDLADYPKIEMSGSTFYTFGLAWGINNGILDRATYEPVLLKAWEACYNCVHDSGMVGWVQPVGAAPGSSCEDYTELYVSGSFLAAGAEMYKFVNKFYPTETVIDNPNTTTFLENGGWCWYQDPRAIINNGKLVIGGIDGVNGDVRIGVYDLKNNKNEGAVVMSKNFEVDDHDTPAFYVRSDNSILAMWAKHGKEKIHHFSISDTNDYLKWGENQQFVHEYPYKAGVTYMNLYYMKDEKRLYNFFRDGQTFNPAFMTSEDEGKTWSKSSPLIQDNIGGRNRPYARYIAIDENTVGISYTDAHPRDYGNSLYYVEYRNGSIYTADGKKVHDIKDGALCTADGEKIYTGSEVRKKPYECESVPNSAWTCAVAKDANSHPHIAYTLYNDNNDHRYRIASWDGKKWNDREIAYGGKCLYWWESSYTGLLCFDPENPTTVYISTDVNPSTGEDLGGKHEIYRGNVGAADDISTIKWEAITSNSKYRNIRPMVVAKDGHKVLLWLHGQWGTFVNYDVDVVGKILN